MEEQQTTETAKRPRGRPPKVRTEDKRDAAILEYVRAERKLIRSILTDVPTMRNHGLIREYNSATANLERALSNGST